MHRPDAEATIPLLAAVLLVAASGLAVAVGPVGGVGAATHGDEPAPRDRIQFDPPVPDEYDFGDPPTADGVATVDGTDYDSLDAALDAAGSGDTVHLRGRFDGPVTVETPGVTLAGAGVEETVLAGDGEGTVLTLSAANVTVRGLWVRDAGWNASANDAAIWVAGDGSAVVDCRVTDTTFGVWIDGASEARVIDTTIVGRESVRQHTNRGNGVQLWEATDAVVRDNRITDVRDGIYYSFSSGVVARNNTLWDLRYGVHYMYSDGNRLADNTAFDNDVGYALMVSEDLQIVDNVAVNNTGRSGHGILVKSVDDTEISGNHLVGNDKGLYVYNALNNTVADNLLLANRVGVHLTAGSVRERVTGNSFVRNDDAVKAVVESEVVWNASRGNYWATASVADADDDGISETRYRPEGLLDRVTAEHPAARVFVGSPAFDLVRLAERTLPAVETPGVVDEHPLARSPHDWRRYYATRD
ncbi:nitrous oxide reductase family maturation protein NosD [Salinirubrum litoreum]|uniref:Nitrous oxide reductase family maturation protein NosD n=1 Tax=Salinirubrum litoreum TaxID=1126234 RepID=A0ABD5RDI2_9EURY|nr:nitrous oxide reductase family maturation protein NosD [Salinirubrum litoreum]